MSFNGGSDIMTAVVKAVSERVTSEEDRLAIYKAVYHECEMQDWDGDGVDAGLDPVYDKAFQPYLLKTE